MKLGAFLFITSNLTFSKKIYKYSLKSRKSFNVVSCKTKKICNTIPLLRVIHYAHRAVDLHILSVVLRYQVQLHRMHTDWPDIIDSHISEETEIHNSRLLFMEFDITAFLHWGGRGRGRGKGNLISYRQRDSQTSLTYISSLKSDYMCTAIVHVWV